MLQYSSPEGRKKSVCNQSLLGSHHPLLKHKILDVQDVALTLEEVEIISHVYETYGAVRTLTDVREFIRSTTGQHLLDDEVEDLAEQIKFAEGGALTREQLLLLMQLLKERHLQSIVDVNHEAFYALSGGTDSIDADAFRGVCHDFKLTVDVEKLLAEADEDGSGVIELDEFEMMIACIENADETAESSQADDASAAGAENEGGVPSKRKTKKDGTAGEYDDEEEVSAVTLMRSMFLKNTAAAPGGGGVGSRNNSGMWLKVGNNNNNNDAPSRGGGNNNHATFVTNFTHLSSELGDIRIGIGEVESEVGSSQLTDSRAVTAPSAEEGSLRTASVTRHPSDEEDSNDLFKEEEGSAEDRKKKSGFLHHANSRGGIGSRYLIDANKSHQQSAVLRPMLSKLMADRNKKFIDVLNDKTGKTERLKMPPKASAGRLSRVYDRSAPKWTVNYNDFVKKV